MKKELFIWRIAGVLLCLCAHVWVIAHDNDTTVCISIPFSETILTEQDDEYIKDSIRCVPLAKSRYCKYSFVDSTLTSDTLVGRAVYLLYFDTINMVEGEELQRTKDSLFLMTKTKPYGTFTISEKERMDLLLRDYLSTKRLWMDKLTPYYIPYHHVTIDFIVLPH